jgi:hypothetical protein
MCGSGTPPATSQASQAPAELDAYPPFGQTHPSAQCWLPLSVGWGLLVVNRSHRSGANRIRSIATLLSGAA